MVASRSNHGCFEQFLRSSIWRKELLRFTTAGSVDDGKVHADRPAAARHEGCV